MPGAGGQEVGRISIRVVPDLDGFYEKLKAAVEWGDKQKIEVDVDADARGIRQKIKAETSGIEAKVKVDVDRSAMDRIGGFFSNLTTDSGGGGAGIRALGPFADNLALVAAVAAIAAPAIALVTGALAALPAIVAGIATPIGVIALGLDGIKKAAEQLKKPLDTLKTSISGVFERRLTPVFGLLAQAMPKLETPLKAVADGISDVATSFVNAISTGPGLARIQGTISNIASAISTAAPGIGSLTNGLLGLAEGVSAKFPAVSRWFNDAAGAFQNWVDKATADGSLDAAMGNLGTTLKGILDIGGDIAKQGFEWLKDPEFGKSMTDFVNNTKTLVSDIMPGLGGLFQQISGALDGIVPALDRLDSWKPPDWMHLADKPDKKGGIGGGLTDDLKEVDKTIKGFGGFPGMEAPDKPWFGGALGKQLDEAERKITSLKDGLSFDNLLGTGANNPFKNGLISSQLTEAFNPKNLLGDWDGNPLLVKIKEAFDLKNNMFGLGSGNIFDSLGMPQAAAETGTQSGTALGQSLGQGFAAAQAQGGVQTQLQSLGPQIQATIAAATQPLQQIPAQVQQAFAGVGAAVQGSLATVVGAVANAGSQIQAAFTGSLSQIPAIATQAFSQVQAAASAGMGNVVTAITTGAAQAVAAVQTMGTQIVAALQSAASGAQAAGAQVGAGMAAGIRGSIGGAVAAAHELASAVTAAAQTNLGIHSPSKVFQDIGVNLGEGMALGMDEGFQPVIEKAKSLAQQITDAMNGGLGVDQTLKDQLKPTLDELELQRKKLKVDKNALPKEDKTGRQSLTDQMAQLQTLKDQLNLQKDQLGFSDKYGDSVDANKDSQTMMADSLNKVVDIGKGFAMANANQFMSDIGMSGKGAIPTIAGLGLDWASGMLSKAVTGGMGGGTTINVGSVDDALSAKQTIDNRKALQYKNR